MEGDQVAEEQKIAFLSNVEQERKEKMDEIRKNLKEILSRVRRNENLIEEQEETIDNLPDDFWENYKANYLNIEYSAKTYLDYRKTRGLPIDTRKFPNNEVPPTTDEQGYVTTYGDLFESLVRADRQICEGETDLGQELRSILSEPLRYEEALSSVLPGENFDYLRNPDIASIDEETGLLKGWTECKTARFLDERAINQLSRLGFERSVRLIIEKIQKIKESFDKIGLAEIARVAELKVDKTLKLKLAIPFKEIPNGNGPMAETIRRSLINPRMTEAQRKKALGILYSYEINMSCFSKEELKAIQDFLYPKLKQELRVS